MSAKRRIEAITLDESSMISRSPQVENERAVAIADLLEENQFCPWEPANNAPMFEGPYHVHLSIEEARLCFAIHGTEEGGRTEIRLPVMPLRTIIKDYFLICESYYKAIQANDRSKVEAVDMGRRGVHNEGAERLAELLQDKIFVDFETARRLFTLVSVLHLRVQPGM
jgi:uncharacterized protein (UPF0262 family)